MTGDNNSQESKAADAIARLRADLVWTTGKHRVDLILETPDPQAVVQSLPAEELYFLIRDVGMGDSAALVQLASPEQFRTFLDLDVWRGEQIEPTRALPWLRAARAGSMISEQDSDSWQRKLAALDPELLSLIMLSTLRIHDLEQDPDPEFQSDRFMRTPEGKYILEFFAEGTDYLAIRGFIDDLYAADPFLATRIINAIRWEFPSELTESERRWRAGRLADLGFPELDEALSWFTRPPAKPPQEAGLPERPAGFFLAQFQRGSLLDRAAERLAPAKQERFEQELVTAANAALVANAVDPGDLEAVHLSVEMARAMLELGLELLAGSDVDRASETLATTPLKRVFQHGFGRILELAWRAERLWQTGNIGTREAPLLDPPLGEALIELSRKRPAYFPGVEAPRHDWGSLAVAAFEPRPFLSSKELERTAKALELAEGLGALARKLELIPSSASGPQAPRLSALYLTALANQRLGRPFRPDPIPLADLGAARRALQPLDDPRLSTEGEAGALLAELAARRAEELAAMGDVGEIRPGQVTALLVAG